MYFSRFDQESSLANMKADSMEIMLGVVHKLRLHEEVGRSSKNVDFCFFVNHYKVKFIFSKKATKIDKIFTVDLTLTT